MLYTSRTLTKNKHKWIYYYIIRVTSVYPLKWNWIRRDQQPLMSLGERVCQQTCFISHKQPLRCLQVPDLISTGKEGVKRWKCCENWITAHASRACAPDWWSGCRTCEQAAVRCMWARTWRVLALPDSRTAMRERSRPRRPSFPSLLKRTLICCVSAPAVFWHFLKYYISVHACRPELQRGIFLFWGKAAALLYMLASFIWFNACADHVVCIFTSLWSINPCSCERGYVKGGWRFQPLLFSLHLWLKMKAVVFSWPTSVPELCLFFTHAWQ